VPLVEDLVDVVGLHAATLGVTCLDVERNILTSREIARRIIFMSRDLSLAAGSRRAVMRTAVTPALWGTTYLVATEFLPPGRPMLAATVRALPVGLVVVALAQRLPFGRWWWRSAVLGVLNIGAFFALLFVAAFRLPGGVAATAGAVQPLLASGLAALVLREALIRRVLAAGLLGLGGVGFLVLGPEAALDPVGVAAALAGAASMATGVVLTKRWGRPVDLLTFTGWQLTAGGLVLVPVLLVSEGLPSTVSGTEVAGFVWLAVVGTGLAYANWFRGIQELPVAVVSLLGLLSPVVATLLGAVVLDERLTLLQLLGAGLVVGAVVAPHAHRAPRRPTRRDVAVARASPVGSDMLAGCSPPR
jgi:probable blue pigment (indigoidine) exporter